MATNRNQTDAPGVCLSIVAFCFWIMHLNSADFVVRHLSIVKLTYSSSTGQQKWMMWCGRSDSCQELHFGATLGHREVHEDCPAALLNRHEYVGILRVKDYLKNARGDAWEW
jgi:hypothetical protein